MNQKSVVPPHLTGTQAGWDYMEQAENTRGLRHFREGNVVKHDDGRIGRVRHHSALYAHVRWEDGTFSEIEQYTPDVLTIRER